MQGYIEPINTDSDKEILEKLTKEFDPKALKKKGKFYYIPETLIRDRLQEVLGLNWNFVVSAELDTTFKNEPAIVVRGKITVFLPSGRVVEREGYGGSLLKNGMSAGDAHKSAASNALKKSAYLLGVGAYLGLESLDGIDDTTNWGSSNNSSWTSGKSISGFKQNSNTPTSSTIPWNNTQATIPQVAINTSFQDNSSTSGSSNPVSFNSKAPWETTGW